MNSYLVQLRLKSGLGTPLASDTLWGHIAWGIRYRHGEAALRDWLARYEAVPPLVISDPMPSGYLPRPALPPADRPASAPTPQEADARKATAKKVWMTTRNWERVCGSLGAPDAGDTYGTVTPDAPALHDGQVTHAGINRLTGGTAQAGGGALFTTELAFPAEPQLFDVWTLSPAGPDEVSRWFEDGLAGGYGRDAATGAGALTVETVGTAAIPGSQSPENPNAVVLLGAAVPAPGDPFPGFYSFGVRCGRLGGGFAIGELPGGVTNRQKRPVHCLLRGTVLLTAGAAPSWVGQLVGGVHQLTEIRHYALAPVLPCRLAPVLLEHPLLRARGQGVVRGTGLPPGDSPLRAQGQPPVPEANP